MVGFVDTALLILDDSISKLVAKLIDVVYD